MAKLSCENKQVPERGQKDTKKPMHVAGNAGRAECSGLQPFGDRNGDYKEMRIHERHKTTSGDNPVISRTRGTRLLLAAGIECIECRRSGKQFVYSFKHWTCTYHTTHNPTITLLAIYSSQVKTVFTQSLVHKC